MAVRGTWNFVWEQATPVHGSTGEAQMNMDVNLHRLPDKKEYNPKFLVPLAVMMRSLHLPDCPAILQLSKNK